MAQAMHKKVRRYSVSYFGGGNRTAQPFDYRAAISLIDKNGGLIAQLRFHNDPSTLPDGDYLPDEGRALSHYPIEDFPRILDLLRNERPIYYNQWADWPSMAWL